MPKPTDSGYYDDELMSALDPGSFIRGIERGELKFQLRGPHDASKWLDLNRESVEALRRFLDYVEPRMED